MAKKKFNFAEFIDENRMPIILGAIILAFVGFVALQGNSNKINLDGIDTKKHIAASEQTGEIAEHIYRSGSKDAKVTLVQYGDFQCPSCATVSPKLRSLAENYGEKIAIIYRNFPLSGHQNALSAAAAAEAAGIQGKYWEMHDKLYEKQSEWGLSNVKERTEHYKKYAKEVGVKDEAKFIEDMKSSAVAKKIAFDKNLGTNDKITGTPSFFLNGKEISSEIWGDDAKFREEIEKLIK